MNRRIKWGLLALLGFSTACSTVRSSAKGEAPPQDADNPTEEVDRSHIRLMYGVRPPVPVEEAERQDSISRAREQSRTGAAADAPTDE